LGTKYWFGLWAYVAVTAGPAPGSCSDKQQAVSGTSHRGAIFLLTTPDVFHRIASRSEAHFPGEDVDGERGERQIWEKGPFLLIRSSEEVGSERKGVMAATSEEEVPSRR
jgi:hypothetical protein